MKQGVLRTLVPVAVVLTLSGALTLLIGCPLRQLFGVSCPLCGMGRAFLCALRLELAEAFRFHPLWPLVLPGLMVWVILEQRGAGRSKPVWMSLLFLFAAVYVVRLWKQDPVVVPALHDGLVTRLFCS